MALQTAWCLMRGADAPGLYQTFTKLRRNTAGADICRLVAELFERNHPEHRSRHHDPWEDNAHAWANAVCRARGGAVEGWAHHMNRKMRRAESRKTGRQVPADMRPAPVRRFVPKPGIITRRFSEAVHCQEMGQLTEAIVLYDRIISLDPGIPEVHNNRGVALAKLERWGDAETSYRLAIAIDANNADAFNNLGNVLCDLFRLEEAEHALRRATQLAPRMGRFRTNLGLVFQRQAKLREAEAAHREAIILDPLLAEAYSNLGETLCGRGELEEAERTLRRALCLNNRYAEARVCLAVVLKAQNRYVEAEAMCREAISLNPRLASAYNTMGNVLLGLSRLDEAETALREAIALQPHCAEAISNLGNVLREQGQMAAAEAAYRQSIAINSNLAEAHYNLGYLLVSQDRLVEAEIAYREAVAIKPDFANAHNNLGATLKFLGRFADARQSVNQALRLVPTDASFLFNLSEIKRFTIGDPDLVVLENLVLKVETLPSKKQIDLHFALAKAYEDLDRPQSVMQHLLRGNALMRAQIHYDEPSTLGEFDHIAEIFTPEFMRMFAGAGEPSSLPVFIVGMPRSGTTLIEQILASHPQVFGGGELSTLKSIAARTGTPSDGSTASYDVIAEMLRRVGAEYVSEVARMAPHATRITDKMPSNFRYAGLIHTALPNARIIHVLRDPLDTCFSCFSKLFANGQNQTYDMGELGRYYLHYRKLMDHWHRVMPSGRIMDVQYEDVVSDLEGQARRIIAHCGLEWDSRCLAFHSSNRPVHTASAVQVRQPLYRSAIARAASFRPFLQPLLDALWTFDNTVARPDAETLGHDGTTAHAA